MTSSLISWPVIQPSAGRHREHAHCVVAGADGPHLFIFVPIPKVVGLGGGEIVRQPGICFGYVGVALGDEANGVLCGVESIEGDAAIRRGHVAASSKVNALVQDDIRPLSQQIGRGPHPQEADVEV